MIQMKNLKLILTVITSLLAFGFSFDVWSQTTNASQNVKPTSLMDANERMGQEQSHNEQFRQMHNKEGDRGKKFDPNNLTDSEKQMSENYVHQGLIDEKMKENCKGRDMEAACAGREVRHKFMGMDSNMVKALSKAYTMVVGMGGLGGDLKKRGADTGKSADGAKDAGGKDGAKGGDKKDDKQTDYCKYIAVATEVVAMFQQKSSQENLKALPENQDTAQKDMLYRAARSHDERAKNAKIQRNGWGITAACYTGMLTVAQLDWNLGLKLASSYLMTGFFQSEVKNHEKYRDKVLEIANKLPGRGDCNPITERDCYCTHSTTKNDPQYCHPQLHKNKIAATSIRTTCVNNHLKADPQCSCRTSNTCFDQTFMEFAGPGFGSLSRGVKGPVTKLAKGELVGADGNLAALKNQGAIRNALRKFDSKAKPKGLSKSQKDIAKTMKNMGIPARLAGLLATKPSSAKGNAFANGLNSSGGSYSPTTYSPRSRRGKGANVLTFSGGNNLRSKGKKSKRSRATRNSRYKKKTKRSGKILKFAEKAASEAGISQDKSKPIFEIISRRYQLSAPKRLELE